MIRQRYDDGDDVKAEAFDGFREITEGLDEARRRRMKTEERALVMQGDFIVKPPDVLSFSPVYYTDLHHFTIPFTTLC